MLMSCGQMHVCTRGCVWAPCSAFMALRAEGTWGVQCRVVCMNCERIMDRQIFQDQLSELNPGAYEAVERMVSTIRRNRQAAREARQRGMTPDGVQRPKFDAEVQKTGGPKVLLCLLRTH